MSIGPCRISSRDEGAKLHGRDGAVYFDAKGKKEYKNIVASKI